MSSTPTPPAPAPVTVSLQGGALSDVLAILSAALSVLAAIPATAAGAALAEVLISVITAAVQRIESQTGKPIDLTQIPVETPLP